MMSDFDHANLEELEFEANHMDDPMPMDAIESELMPEFDGELDVDGEIEPEDEDFSEANG